MVYIWLGLGVVLRGKDSEVRIGIGIAALENGDTYPFFQSGP